MLDLAAELKRQRVAREPHRPLEGLSLGLLFRRHSTRTRVSLTVAMTQLGGAVVDLPASELQLARGESIGDTARVLSRYLDGLAVRTGPQTEVDELAATASVPVVNALTDDEHPLQALADLLMVRERFGGLDGVRIAWVGDGTNVCVSLAAACRLLGVELVCASPAGYEPRGLEVVRDPREAAAGAQVLVTDTWTSMGQEDERTQRLEDLAPYALDAKLLAHADPDAIVLPLPARAPGRGDRRRRALRATLGRLGRGREPAAHRESPARAPPRLATSARRATAAPSRAAPEAPSSARGRHPRDRA